MSKPEKLPEQSQESQPGLEHKLTPTPEVIRKNYQGSQKLKGRNALITGGDSGIGRSIALHYAKEGAGIFIVHTPKERKDATDTKNMVEKEQVKCILCEGDIKSEEFCKKLVEDFIDEFGKLHILVNNAAVQFPKDKLEEVSRSQVEETFRTNIISIFSITRYALPYLEENARIINSTSVTAYRGSKHLVDYAATKGAITAFTRSLSTQLAPRKILVNAVAPGPIWTPLIPATFDEVEDFGKKTPLGRPGQPSEVGPCYVFLASEDATYITGQVLHPNGGEIINA
jgi:NAD(P)-dependent dehydrogenase (short-subunit alcohol dehydrogenase family)